MDDLLDYWGHLENQESGSNEDKTSEITFRKLTLDVFIQPLEIRE